MPGLNGLVVMTPTSIASTGTGNSSSINADGSVDFASCATLSLNGVFTSSYDNYMVVCRTSNPGIAGAADAYIRFRAGGTDNSTASSYVSQLIQASSTSISASRSTSNIALIGANYNSETQRNGFTLHVFGPAISQPTAVRSLTISSSSSAYLADVAITHNQSVAYDGLTFSLQTSSAFTASGLITVFGFNQ